MMLIMDIKWLTDKQVNWKTNQVFYWCWHLKFLQARHKILKHKFTRNTLFQKCIQRWLHSRSETESSCLWFVTNQTKNLFHCFECCRKKWTFVLQHNFYNFWLINLDESEDMDGRSTEFGLRSADYDQDAGEDTVRWLFRRSLRKLINRLVHFQMDLQRRGHTGELGPNKGRVYWRCYFNAVTCF